MNDQPVTAALKSLREEAGVGVREMARRLGMSGANSYTHYENPDRFKSQFLPMEWAIRFADALEPSGIDRARVLALAGAAPDSSGDLSLDARVARLSRRRHEMMLALLEDLEAAEEADRAQQGKSSDDAD